MEKLLVDGCSVLYVAEATKAEVEEAARLIACLRCLRRSRAYDFTRHVEVERLFALLANAMGMETNGLYVELPRGELVHPYPVHILAREVEGATRKPDVGRTRVAIEFRDKDDHGGPFTRETLEEELRRDGKGVLGNEEAWTDPRFGDRIVSEVLNEHARPLWSQLSRGPEARVAQFAWAALRYESLRGSEAFSREMARLRGDNPEEHQLGTLVIQVWPNEDAVAIRLTPDALEDRDAGKTISATRSDLRDSVDAVSLVWPVRVLDRVLKRASQLEPKVRKRPRVVRFDVLRQRGRATLTEHLAYWLVKARAGPRFSIEEARDALGMKSRQAVWRALRDGKRKQPRKIEGKPAKKRSR